MHTPFFGCLPLDRAWWMLSVPVMKAMGEYRSVVSHQVTQSIVAAPSYPANFVLSCIFTPPPPPPPPCLLVYSSLLPPCLGLFCLLQTIPISAGFCFHVSNAYEDEKTGEVRPSPPLLLLPWLFSAVRVLPTNSISCMFDIGYRAHCSLDSSRTRTRDFVMHKGPREDMYFVHGSNRRYFLQVLDSAPCGWRASLGKLVLHEKHVHNRTLELVLHESATD